MSARLQASATGSNHQTARGTLVLATSDIRSTFLNLGKVTDSALPSSVDMANFSDAVHLQHTLHLDNCQVIHARGGCSLCTPVLLFGAIDKGKIHRVIIDLSSSENNNTVRGSRFFIVGSDIYFRRNTKTEC
jgi:hypothetical protein